MYTEIQMKLKDNEEETLSSQEAALHYHSTGRRDPGRPHKRCK
jgi:hypothetical protein